MDSSSDSEIISNLVPGYDPFIGDVPISSSADPFPYPHPDTRSPNEINRIKRKLSSIIMNKSFNPPVKLKDFCIIAPERWDRQNHPENYPPSSSSEGGCTNNCKII